MSQIKNFKDLKVWQKSHKLVIAIYKATARFPNGERFCLISQVRRAVISVASNIVEGFHRASLKESLYFYHVATASLEEVKYQLLIAKDLQYLSESDYNSIFDLADEVGKMLYSRAKSQVENNKTK